MGVLLNLTTILLALPMCRSNSVGEFSNYEVGLYKILQRMESLEARLSECTRKAEHLEQSQWRQENEIRLQASKIEQLESPANTIQVKELENKLKETLEIIDKLVKEVEITKLQRRLDNNSSDQLQTCEKCEECMQNQSLNHTSGRTNIDQISSNGKIIGRISKISRMKRTSGLGKTNVAFAVSMAVWNEFTLAAHEPLPFNVVRLNDGNGFDSNLKSFICPVTGIYFFTASIISNYHKFEGSIVIDGDEKVDITTGDGPGVEQGSSSIVTLCSKGQRVYVYAYNGANSRGIALERFSVFSGFLLTELESASS